MDFEDIVTFERMIPEKMFIGKYGRDGGMFMCVNDQYYNGHYDYSQGAVRFKLKDHVRLIIRSGRLRFKKEYAKDLMIRGIFPYYLDLKYNKEKHEIKGMTNYDDDQEYECCAQMPVNGRFVLDCSNPVIGEYELFFEFYVKRDKIEQYKKAHP